MLNQKVDSIKSRKQTNIQKQLLEADEAPGVDVKILVLDFLAKKNLNKTMEIFEREWNQINQNEHLTAKITQSFDAGQTKEFFNNFYIFQKNLSTKTPILELDKSEFYYHVYFAIYDIHPQLGGPKEHAKEASAKLKIFLEEKGSELSKFPELIPFFAFPYIKNPKEHDTFKHLFQPNWVNKVRENLISYLKSSQTNTSELETALNSLKRTGAPLQQQMWNQNNEEVNRLNKELKIKESEIQELNQRYDQLDLESKETMREIHQKWSTFVRLGNQGNTGNCKGNH